MNDEMVSRVLTSVDETRVIALEQAMVRIPSFTLEEAELALYLRRYMEAAGLDVELQAVPSGEKTVGVQPVGRLRGTARGPSLLLSGHMDYIGLEDREGWLHPPFSATVEDGYIYGRGTKDEKGGICAAIAAAESLARSGIRLKGDLIVAPVMGHKTKVVGGGVGARHLVASGVTADMAIVTENSNLGIATRCVGRVTAKLHLEGLSQPFETSGTDFYTLLGGLINRLGPNSASAIAGGWLTFRPDADYPGFPMLLFGSVDVSSRRCTLGVNIRTVPGQTPESVQADLEKALAGLGGRHASHRSRVEIMHPVRYPHDIAVDDPLVQTIASAHAKVRGAPPEIGLGPRRGAVADSWFLIDGGITRTTVYGPGTIGPDLANAPDERIAIQDLVDCARVYALTAAQLCGIA